MDSAYRLIPRQPHAHRLSSTHHLSINLLSLDRWQYVMVSRSARSTHMSDDAPIDLTRYKTKELASTVAEMLAVPASIRIVLGTTFYAIILVLIANSLLYAIGNPSLIPWLLSTIYALVIALALGFVLGLIRVAGLLVSRSERVLQLTLETSYQVALDYRAVRSGGSRMPTSTEIVEHVYDGVVLPAMEASVAKSFGIVGTPLLWIYRRTIGGCVRFLITRMKTTSLTADEQNGIELEADGLMSDIAESQPHIEATILKAQSYTSYAGNMLRIMLLYPIQFVFLLVAPAAVVPLGFCWYWTR